MPPIIGAAILFITSDPVPTDHMMGTSPRNVVATVMNLGPETLDRPVADHFLQIAQRPQPAFLLRLLIGKVEIEKHEDSGLRVHPQQRDQPHPDPDAHVISEQVKKPEGADGGERLPPAIRSESW